MTWPKKRIGGKGYDLSHLSPLTIEVAPKAQNAPTFKVHVSFGFHTFTKGADDSDPPDLRFTHDGDRRCFCPIRYECSLSLPAIIQSLPARKVYFSQRENYVVTHTLPICEGPYAVFFNVSKARSRDANLVVITAYDKPMMPRHPGSISFATLIAKTVLNQEIVRPKK